MACGQNCEHGGIKTHLFCLDLFYGHDQKGDKEYDVQIVSECKWRGCFDIIPGPPMPYQGRLCDIRKRVDLDHVCGSE